MKNTIKKTLLLLVAILAILAMTGCGSKTKIDLQDVIYVEPYGANGYGRVNHRMDEDMLLALIQTDKTDDESLIASLEKLDLISRIDYELDKTKGLSNGDKITVTVTYPDTLEEALGAKLSPKRGGSWTVTVSGLEDVHTFDIFQDFEVTYNGFNGYGVPQIQVYGGTPIGYILSKEEGLSNGDVITVTLTAPGGGDLIEYCLREGFMVEYESKEFTVSGLEEAPIIDLFEEIDITAKGRSPYLELSIRGKYDSIYYELDESAINGKLKIGDTVTIHAYPNTWDRDGDLNQWCIEKEQSLPISDICTYAIPENQEYYLTDMEQLTQDILDQAITEAKDQFDSINKAEEIAVQGTAYYGYYLQTAKDMDFWGDRCRLYIIHEIKYTMDGKSAAHYNVVRFLNPYVDKAGTFRFENVENPYGWVWGGTGVEDLYDFEQDFISSEADFYHNMNSK